MSRTHRKQEPAQEQRPRQPKAPPKVSRKALMQQALREQQLPPLESQPEPERPRWSPLG